MKKVIFQVVFAAFTIVGLANCAKSNDNNSAAVAGYCAVGQVSTQYGCLNQGGCQYGQGLYNNQCIQGTINNNGINNGGSCPAGQILTTQGCLSPGACYPTYPNYGFYNGYCYPATNGTTNVNNGQCGTNSIYTTQHGCVQSCGANMGYVNGQCVNVGASTSTGNGWLY